MPAAKCAICGKTAYPLESVTAVEKTYHKACFKCSVCRLQLNLTNFVGLEGKVYCKKHVPQQKATAVTDTVAMRHAENAPKRVAEGLGTVQKGTGERAHVGADTVAMRQAKSAPKRQAEGLGTVQKGTGERAHMVVFGTSNVAEQPAGEEQQYYEEQPAAEAPAEEQYYEEQPAAEAPAEEQYYEEPAAEPAAEAPAEEQYYEEPAAEAPAEEQYYDDQGAAPAEGEYYDDQGAAPAEEQYYDDQQQY